MGQTYPEWKPEVTLLFEKGIPFVSQEMNLAPLGRHIPENFRPGYVRLCMQGAPSASFATGYTGRSAFSSEGFDACVVPTLVDHQAECVVDSGPAGAFEQKPTVSTKC